MSVAFFSLFGGLSGCVGFVRSLNALKLDAACLMYLYNSCDSTAVVSKRPDRGGDRVSNPNQIPSDLGFRRCSARSYSAVSRTAQIAIWIAFRLPSSRGDLGPSTLFHRAARALQQHSAVRQILAFGAAPRALQRRFTAAFSAALPTATPPYFGRP
ncbi:hypothetical protein VNO78_21282 [Psophocarpus tetragonolobus]|uniref:Secreted protein n=1 Tax=Psophocarpus tetragonolobus TaxID=3891 RepID=A0AAN9SAT7_PSOTE